ncbi:hypothetical protein [Aquabacterium sp.]|uniref:hypothetical protein n=1 Tax=Aquabacterium sp. TaxID=1872578 RepID=UPI0035C70319
MRCKEYVFLLSSGQLAEAPLGTRLAGAAHRLMCRHCRAFTANDRALSAVLAQHAERVQEGDAASGDAGEATSPPARPPEGG